MFVTVLPLNVYLLCSWGRGKHFKKGMAFFFYPTIAEDMHDLLPNLKSILF